MIVVPGMSYSVQHKHYGIYLFSLHTDPTNYEIIQDFIII